MNTVESQHFCFIVAIGCLILLLQGENRSRDLGVDRLNYPSVRGPGRIGCGYGDQFGFRISHAFQFGGQLNCSRRPNEHGGRVCAIRRYGSTTGKSEWKVNRSGGV
jgi:hypothetical protein